MGWTTPKTWNVDELVTAAMMNTHLRDNLNYLLSPNRCQQVVTSGYSTTSTAFVDVDPVNLSFSLETYGGPVLVWFSLVCRINSTGYYGGFDVEVDGSRIGSGHGYGVAQYGHTSAETLTFLRLLELDAGTHTFKLQWRVSGATAYILGSTSNAQMAFGAMEI